MNLIETKPVGDANFYKFSVDFVGDDFILGGKTLPLGIVTHDILNIPADRRFPFLGRAINSMICITD